MLDIIKFKINITVVDKVTLTLNTVWAIGSLGKEQQGVTRSNRSNRSNEGAT